MSVFVSESLGDGIEVTLMLFFVDFCIPLISHKKHASYYDKKQNIAKKND